MAESPCVRWDGHLGEKSSEGRHSCRDPKHEEGSTLRRAGGGPGRGLCGTLYLGNVFIRVLVYPSGAARLCCGDKRGPTSTRSRTDSRSRPGPGSGRLLLCRSALSCSSLQRSPPLLGLLAPRHRGSSWGTFAARPRNGSRRFCPHSVGPASARGARAHCEGDGTWKRGPPTCPARGGGARGTVPTAGPRAGATGRFPPSISRVALLLDDSLDPSR